MTSDEILAQIDKIVGAPESETPAEYAKRKVELEARRERHRIEKSSVR